MIEHKVVEKTLKKWFSKKHKDSKLLIKEEEKAKINDFEMYADLIAVQSKSNVIHAFEIKNKLDADKLLPAFWQANSYYTNYRWLVIPKETGKYFLEKISNSKIEEFDVGIIFYDSKNNKEPFEIIRDANYKDGNFLKFWPNLKNEWKNIKKF